MRPRRVCRGKFPISAHTYHSMRGFNEAPACLPGKAVVSLTVAPRVVGASMRPRRVCRGKPGESPKEGKP